MMNTFVTLPLDVLSSKRTVENANEKNEMDIKATPKNSNVQNDRKALMEETWKSIEKKKGKPLPEMAASSVSLSSASASASSSASSSAASELVFHEACSRSEDLFSLHRETGQNEDDDHDENNMSTYSTTSTTSNSSMLSNNDEYKLRWKERLEQRKTRRLRRKRQLEQNVSDNSTEIITNAADSSESSTSTAAFNTNITTNAAGSTESTTSSAAFTTSINLASIRRWSKLWKGLAPALLLCSNPSIHYTVFDVLKTKLLAWKRLGSRRGIRQQLSVSEAFVLGLLSKFVATILTYPLIRAKVMMMVMGDHPIPGTESESEGKASSDSVSSPTLWSVLKESYQRDGGIPGLYKGCDWQLIHTLLKTALMMAIREQITGTSRALFGVSSK